MLTCGYQCYQVCWLVYSGVIVCRFVIIECVDLWLSVLSSVLACVSWFYSVSVSQY